MAEIDRSKSVAANGTVPPPKTNMEADIAEIREALKDPAIASYPDFTRAVSLMLDEVETLRREVARFKPERSYVVGCNEGFANAAEQALEIVEHENTKWLPGGPVDIKGLLRRLAEQVRALSATMDGSEP